MRRNLLFPLTLQRSNALDLEAEVLGQLGDLDAAASRVLALDEPLGVFGVHLSEVVHVGEEDVDLDDLLHRRASSLDDLQEEG